MITNILKQGRDLAVQYAGDGASWVQDMDVYQRKVEMRKVGDVTTVYKGWSDFGSAEGDAVWRVHKIVFDESTYFDLDAQAAEGDTFNNAWTDRESLTYG